MAAIFMIYGKFTCKVNTNDFSYEIHVKQQEYEEAKNDFLYARFDGQYIIGESYNSGNEALLATLPLLNVKIEALKSFANTVKEVSMEIINAKEKSSVRK